MDFRLSSNHYLHDNGLQLKEPQEVYVLAYEFFSGFSKRYGVDVEIKLVRYKSVEDICDINFRIQGPLYSSFDMNDSMYFNKYEYLYSMPNSERREKEMELMNVH